MSRRLLALTLLGSAGWGCVYYNGLWSAHRYAAQARRQERTAATPDAAVSSWLLAAVEAESVAVHHPHSRWLPDALVTVAEGLGWSGDCSSAEPFLERADSVAAEPALRERLALVRATCALRLGSFGAAEAYARPVLRSRDEERRRDAALLAGRAARRGGDPAGAAEILAQSPERAAGVEEVLSLIEAGMPARADTMCQALVRRRPLEDDWDSVFAAFSRAIGAESTSAIVTRVVPRARLSSGARARMYLDDGNRLLAAGLAGTADARFVAALTVAPDSAEADRAEVARVRARVARLTTPDSLAAVGADLALLMQRGRGAADARRLQQALRQLGDSDSTVTGAFRGGELARDSLDAHPLAAALLLRFARRQPHSVFAPKAILAAMPLTPERADSLARVLEAQYGESPYTLAFRGAPSPGYVTAEDSLARLFGVRVTPIATGVRVVAQWPIPRTGPRGPRLDSLEGAPPGGVRPPVVPGRRSAPRDTIN